MKPTVTILKKSMRSARPKIGNLNIKVDNVRFFHSIWNGVDALIPDIELLNKIKKQEDITIQLFGENAFINIWSIPLPPVSKGRTMHNQFIMDWSNQ